MKKISAVIKPFKLDEVKEALKNVLGSSADFTVTETKEFEEGEAGFLIMGNIRSGFLSRLTIEVVVDDNLVGKTKEAIETATSQERGHEVTIEVQSVEQCVDIGTGEVFEHDLSRPVRVIAQYMAQGTPVAG